MTLYSIGCGWLWRDGIQRVPPYIQASGPSEEAEETLQRKQGHPFL